MTTNNNTMSESNIINFMRNIKGQRQGAIHYFSTLAQFPKKKYAHIGIVGVVTKFVERQCQFDRDYTNSVNNQLVREGKEATFESGHLKAGERYMEGLYRKVIENTFTGQKYVVWYPFEGAHKTTQYFINGVPANAEQTAVIAEWESKRNTYKVGTQAAAGIERQVNFAYTKFDGITYLACGGQVLTCETKPAA
jgi:hypothetical protein